MKSLISALSVTALTLSVSGEELPKLTDDCLELTLFAEDPDIVTPIGMVIDERDRIFVIESHTHHPPSDYSGPESDRIKLFIDRDFDGQPDSISIFADGIREAMNLALAPTGELYVACAREVLLLVDNDPDARGPNRLLHVIRTGDYGYKSLYGGGGNHPFQGWDGTLPGALPFIAGTGEAPSGLLDCKRSNLPKDYRHSILATIWNENSIVRFEVVPQGSTLIANEKTVFLAGPRDFRPVAIDCDSRGNIFITDWVLVNYPNHGRGRIWRVSCRDTSKAIEPQRYYAPYVATPAENGRLKLAEDIDQQRLIVSLRSDDAFIRYTAQTTLAASRFKALRDSLAKHADAQLRLGALLATKRAASASPEFIRQFLVDPDQTIRQAALMWAGESLQIELRPHLVSALTKSPVGARLFETYLAAVQNLDADFVQAYRARQGRAKDITQRLAPEVLLHVATDDRFTDEVRGMAIRRFDEATVITHMDWLLAQIRSSEDPLAISIIRRFGGILSGRNDMIKKSLIEMATDDRRSSVVRCEALLALNTVRVADPQRCLPLLTDVDADVAVETARVFRAWFDAGWAKTCVEPILQLQLAPDTMEALSHARQMESLGNQNEITRPATNDAWRETLMAGGSAGRGRRVFFTERVTCAKCHTVDGRGGVLGPDLSRVAQSRTRNQIVDTILEPSADFPPQYQAWVVITADGRIHRGLQLDHKSGGAIAMMTEEGVQAYFKADDIEEYDASPSSLMPTGLSETMSVGEFRDLVAFLESLK